MSPVSAPMMPTIAASSGRMSRVTQRVFTSNLRAFSSSMSLRTRLRPREVSQCRTSFGPNCFPVPSLESSSLKEWMGLKSLWKFQLDSSHVLGFIHVRLSALIATNSEGFNERRESSHSIGLSQGNSMPEEKILADMKPVVLAKNHPAIVGVFPHHTPAFPVF